jgi:thioredoxin
MNTITDIKASSFAAAVLKSPQPILVDFHADWCPPCRVMRPALEQLATEFAGRLKFVGIDAEEEQELAKRYGVESIPTLVVFSRGRPVTRKVGAASLTDLRTLLEQILDAGASSGGTPH